MGSWPRPVRQTCLVDEPDGVSEEATAGRVQRATGVGEADRGISHTHIVGEIANELPGVESRVSKCDGAVG